MRVISKEAWGKEVCSLLLRRNCCRYHYQPHSSEGRTLSRGSSELQRRSYRANTASRPFLRQPTPLQHSCTASSSAADAAEASTSGDSQGFWPRLESGLGAASLALTNFFPLLVLSGCLLGVWRPSLFLWFGDYITGGLALTMLSMGTTLTVAELTGVMRFPARVALGAALQYTIMPALGFAISRLAGLPTPFAVGICMVACCPGGTASNVVTFLARADVALSVCMTTVSTLLAVATTPLLTKLLVGQLVPVNAAGLFMSTVQVVLLPIVLGALLNQRFPRQVQRTAPFAPLLAVSMVVLVCACIMAQNSAAVKTAGWHLIASCASLHIGGFGFGYALSRVLGMPERVARTNSIEVGMQNSALGAVLAALHFQDPLTPVPCAISACLHSIIGSALAGYWRLQGEPDDGEDALEVAAA